MHQLSRDMALPDSPDQDNGNSSQHDLNNSLTQTSSSIPSTPLTSSAKKATSIVVHNRYVVEEERAC
jgi:hypothetical protein